MRGRELDDFIATATADQLREHLAHMRRVFARTAEPAPSVVTPAPPSTNPASAIVVRDRTNPDHLSGPYLQAFRKRLNLTQRQVAREAGEWRGVLDQIEHDRNLGAQRPARERLLAYYQSLDKAIR